MNTLLLQEVKDAPARVVPLTVEQYHQMLATGILTEGEPIELLDGLLVPKDRGETMTIDPLHSLVVSLLLELAQQLAELGCHMKLQSPITIEPGHEPEPDGLVARGGPRDYLERHPGPTDVLSVIEVANSSLERDRTTKQRIYASAGIGQYVILNLVDGQAEVYEEPKPAEGRYGLVRILGKDDVVRVLVTDGRRLDVPVAQLLP